MVSAVHIPDSPEPVPDEILATLPPEEAAHARELRGYRQVQYVGGRIALRQACGQLGVRPGPLLSTERGAPRVPEGVVGSVSHKRDLAVGMAARAGMGTLGVDLEDYAPERLRIMEHILTPPECEEVRALPVDRQWIEVLLRFSIKESIYKAVDPFVGRYVGFHEAEVRPDLHGAAAVTLNLRNGEGPFTVDARYEWVWGRVLTSVRIRRADG
ncbi:MAG: 4'-phosphopantetheinyl transferase superfamily protein [Myxococcota bacterium]